MNTIPFIDTEIGAISHKVLDIGCVNDDGNFFYSNSIINFTNFLRGSQFVCGHNIFHHELKYLGEAVANAGINSAKIIDTLFLSPILFPTKPYYNLNKDHISTNPGCFIQSYRIAFIFKKVILCDKHFYF